MDTSEIRRSFPVYQKDPNLIFFDSAASSLKVKDAIERVQHYNNELGVNAHRGAYSLAYETTSLYEDSRRALASFIRAHEDEIVFTRGTTSSLNMLAYALMDRIEPGDEIITSELEHHSSLLPWMNVARRKKARLIYVPLTAEGRITVEAFDSVLTDRTRIVALTHASNVMGYITPIASIARSAHKKGALVILDAAQSAPHMPLDVRELDVDFLAFSGHKMFAPTGIGILYGKREILNALDPVEFGGEMVDQVAKDQVIWKEPPLRFEAGTPNIAGVIGFHGAIDFIRRIGYDRIHERTKSIHEYTVAKLKAIDGVTVYNPTSENPIITFNIDGVHPHDAQTVLDQEHIGVRAGHHCAQLVSRFLGVSSTIRASFHVYNDRRDCDALIEGVVKARDFFNAF
ncbi:MAG: aminotransferase class V-fold PLP-dependent enzyme [Acholeplasmataceae bacterium]